MVKYRCANCGQMLGSSGQTQRERCPHCRNVNVPPSGDPIEELAAIAGESRISPLVHQQKPQSTPALDPRRISLGVASLVMIGAVVAFFFLPWIELVVLHLSPFDMLTLNAKALERPKPTPEEEQPEPRRVVSHRVVDNGAGGWERVAYDQYGKQIVGPLPTPAPKPVEPLSTSCAASLAIVGMSPYVYGLGCLMALYGAYSLLSRWRSAAALVGMILCLIGSLLAVGGWWSFSVEFPKPSNALETVIFSHVGLQPACIMAIAASLLGCVLTGAVNRSGK